MQQLPDELLLHVIAFLPPWELAQLQLTCRRLLYLARDAGIWKTACFESSRAEASRRRRDLLAQQNTLAELRTALSTLPTPLNPVAESSSSSSEPAAPVVTSHETTQRARALASWDPAAPGERIDWYGEYVHRHGPLSVGWLETPRDGNGHSSQLREALGMGALYTSHSASKVISPLDDGSICIWDVLASSSSSSTRIGSIAARSKPATVHIPTNLKEETGTIDNVSIDSTHQKAYIAVGVQLTEMDLATLQITSQQNFPFTITALSAADLPTPMTIGTAHTLHQYDPRIPLPSLDGPRSPSPVEHIAGARPAAPAPLSEPGPLSILHPPNSSSIWVAGRFTSLLHYDRRFWPRLASTTFSGARLSALAHLPSPFAPPASSGLPRSLSGTTILAAGAYKGKGSLELYPLDSTGAGASTGYKNRQTASRGRLLCAAPHGARILFADADGALKWVERDASSLVRTTSLAQLEGAGHSYVYEDASAAQARRVISSRARINNHNRNHDRNDNDNDDANDTGIETDNDSGYASSSSPPARSAAYLHTRDIGERERAEQAEDVVQKVLPVRPLGAALPPDSASEAGQATGSNGGVLLQTGEGRIGLLAFTRGDPLVPRWQADADADGSTDDETAGLDTDAEVSRERRDEARERRYDMAMRTALETQAREMWWVRGLGL